jgi:hypothetical protein
MLCVALRLLICFTLFATHTHTNTQTHKHTNTHTHTHTHTYIHTHTHTHTPTGAVVLKIINLLLMEKSLIIHGKNAGGF